MEGTRVLQVEQENKQVRNEANSSDTTRALLRKIFPEQERDSAAVRKTRVLLRELLGQYEKQELEEIITVIQYLSESWLDMYERKVFDGMTLNELLSNGTYETAKR